MPSGSALRPVLVTIYSCPFGHTVCVFAYILYKVRYQLRPALCVRPFSIWELMTVAQMTLLLAFRVMICWRLEDEADQERLGDWMGDNRRVSCILALHP